MPETTETMILGKFKDQAALEAAYTALEQKQSAAQKPDTTPAPKGLDAKALAAELRDNGKLSDASLKTLADAGIPADVFVAGLQTQSTQSRTALAEAAGGEDTLKSVLEWATANLDKSEADAYNQALDSGNLVAAKALLTLITGKYHTAMGTEPNTVVAGDSNASAGVQPFGSAAEMVEAMRDPKYRSDPAFRKVVESRVAVSSARFQQNVNGSITIVP